MSCKKKFIVFVKFQKHVKNSIRNKNFVYTENVVSDKAHSMRGAENKYKRCEQTVDCDEGLAVQCKTIIKTTIKNANLQILLAKICEQKRKDEHTHIAQHVSSFCAHWMLTLNIDWGKQKGAMECNS